LNVPEVVTNIVGVVARDVGRALHPTGDVIQHKPTLDSFGEHVDP